MYIKTILITLLIIGNLILIAQKKTEAMNYDSLINVTPVEKLSMNEYRMAMLLYINKFRENHNGKIRVENISRKQNKQALLELLKPLEISHELNKAAQTYYFSSLNKNTCEITNKFNFVSVLNSDTSDISYRLHRVGGTFDAMIYSDKQNKYCGGNVVRLKGRIKDFVNRFMQHDSARNNILSPIFTHIGIGYYRDNQSLVQLFAKKPKFNIIQKTHAEIIKIPAWQLPIDTLLQHLLIEINYVRDSISKYPAIDDDRRGSGHPMLFDSIVSTCSNDYAYYMYCNNYMGHIDLEGRDDSYRISKYTPIRYQTYRENCACWQRTISEVMDSWMNSSGHRATLIADRVKFAGLGYYKDYWTLNYVTLFDDFKEY